LFLDVEGSGAVAGGVESAWVRAVGVPRIVRSRVIQSSGRVEERVFPMV
jgi:hypothetical protein